MREGKTGRWKFSCRSSSSRRISSSLHVETAGSRIGFWWSEQTHPYWEFSGRGYKMDIYSLDAAKLETDP
jgi:hypothetical protein